MKVGVALPQMAEGLDRRRVRAWCEAIDGGPFSSISAGERITFHNLDGFTLCSAAAALTERVKVFVNVAVLPWHSVAMLAKELASIDVISDGRVELAVGVGGRQQDYAALGASFSGRHRRLDDGVAELRRLWSGGAAADGAVVGPAMVQRNGPPIYASAMGPKSMSRCARWADGVSGFSLLSDVGEVARMISTARAAWADAGRTTQPRLLTGSFVGLGTNDDRTTLATFTANYLRVLAGESAPALGQAMRLHTADALAEFLRTVAATGCDEFIVVPATSDPAMVRELTDVVADLVHEGAVRP